VTILMPVRLIIASPPPESVTVSPRTATMAMFVPTTGAIASPASVHTTLQALQLWEHCVTRLSVILRVDGTFPLSVTIKPYVPPTLATLPLESARTLPYPATTEAHVPMTAVMPQTGVPMYRTSLRSPRVKMLPVSLPPVGR